jgi:3-isopropylmalate/(R)-2-methylmalate dehydratase large subunit
MGSTIVEKILSSRAGRRVVAGDVVNFNVDVRVARDFGGAAVARAIIDNDLPIENPSRTFFTFDFDPAISDQEVATSRQFCRSFARERGIKVFDIGRGIGTHVAVEEGLVTPGRTFVTTDSHASLVGAVGAFGQGMGEQDIAHAFAFGSVWFAVPPTVRVTLKGRPGPWARPKDLALAVLKRLGSRGLLGAAAELYGDAVDEMSMAGRITMASMGTEMGAIIMMLAPSAEVMGYCRSRSRWPFEAVYADADAGYQDEIVVDVTDLRPAISRPGRPADVVEVKHVEGRPIDSVFIGSCTNGTFGDLADAADVLKGKHVAEGVLLHIVPATDAVWNECLDKGLVSVFKEAGALFGISGCAGCTDGQLGRSGPGEVTVSTGNRNFRGALDHGDIYLASPATAAASAVAGAIADVEGLSSGRVERRRTPRVPFAGGVDYAIPGRAGPASGASQRRVSEEAKPVNLSGRVWVVGEDDIAADMIYHNSRLRVTDKNEMGRHAFGNLPGWEDFPQKAKPGDIVVAGRNFGCGSSRQQAVDCFKSLGIALIVARSFGAIYYRNAINAGLPVITAELAALGIQDGDKIWVDLPSGRIEAPSRGISLKGSPFSRVQMDIYQRGGLLKAR